MSTEETKVTRSHIRIDYNHQTSDVTSPNFEDTTVKESAYDSNSFHGDRNPSRLYRLRGDYSIHEEMILDDQVFVSMQLKKDLVLAGGFEFIVKDEKDTEIKEELDKFFMEDLDVPFMEQLAGILTSYDYGPSFTEKKFMLDVKGRLRLQHLKARHPDTFLIKTDVFGNIEQLVQRGFDGQDIDIPMNSIIRDVNELKFDNQYGESDLEPAFQAWKIKKHIVRYYAIFIEKYGSPIAIGRYDHQKAEVGAVDDIFQALKKLQNSTALVLPKEIDIELLETKSSGEVFIEGINLFNTFIGRSLMIPDLLGFTGSETSGGSFSLGKSQMDIFFKHISRRRERLEALVNHHIIRPIILFNHGDIENFPKFQLKPLQQEDADKFAQTWIEAVKGNIWTPTDDEVNHLRGMLRFPTSDVVERPKQFSPFGSSHLDEENEDKPAGSGNTGHKADGIEGAEQDGKIDKKDNAHTHDLHNGNELLDTSASRNDENFEIKMDFGKIEKHFDRMLDKGLEETIPIINDVIESIIEQIDKKKIISNKKIERIQDIKPKKLKQLNEAVQSILLDNFTTSKTIAMEELISANNMRNDFNHRLTSNEFLELLKSETFDYIGDLQANLSKIAKVEIVAAIKDGKTMEETAILIRETGRRAAVVSIERYYRTKLTETANQGRVEFFTESGIVHGYQYSAILDSRTTVICSGLHGKKFAADGDGPSFGTPIPPMHFNCRSILIPITTNEAFTKSRSVSAIDPDTGERQNVPIDDFISDNIGKGFSVG